jgi:L-ribulose-5-phosphate 4-epimerase
MLERELRQRVCQANLNLVAHGLVVLTWGNVSGRSASGELMAIKPSGVPYEHLKPSDIVLVDMNGTIVEGTLKPSSDTPTHLEIYRAFAGIAGVAHTHSVHATVWAQAGMPIPCLGTTHADHFHGPVPVTKVLSDDMIEKDYERNTGRVVVEAMHGQDPLAMPACLVQNHGPFTWGRTPEEAVMLSLILEQCAEMALKTLSLNDNIMPIKKKLLFKHFKRKHGGGYGQDEARKQD